MLVVFLVAWAINELYPPTDADLIRHFRQRAANADTNLTAIVTRAQALQKDRPERAFGNLLEAIGTNDIEKYFLAYTNAISDGTEPTRGILNILQKEAAGKIKLGLDLRGGTSFLLEMETNRFEQNSDRQNVLAQAVEVLRKRVDRLGVAEPIIQPQGDNRIMVAMPGLSEAENESARQQIQKAAVLEFRMVHPESDEFVKEGKPAPGYELLRLKAKKGEPQSPPLLVKKKPERGLTGKYIKRAGVQRHPVSGEPEIHFTFNEEGAQKFGDITTEFQPANGRYYRLAIVLDGELYSAPRIMSVIRDSGSISGNFDQKEAFELANVLENPLEAKLHIAEERRVDPSLGKDSIRSGIVSSLIGTVAVVVFMLAYYLTAGVIANVALMLNIIILLGVMCSVGTTLTIPGIAGVVLTIGMAVDANVLIYERIREELAAGKSLRGALNAGYDKAFGTIFDSNLTTLISSVILIYMGTGPVKGFGVTLTIGVTVSMFTALVVTRLIFDWLLQKNLISSLPMLHIVKGNKIDFMAFAKPAFAISWTIIIIGCGYGISRGSGVLGVDFKGGDSLTLSFAQRVEVDKLRDSISKSGIKEASIQYQRDLSTGKENLRMVVPVDEGPKAHAVLMKDFPVSKFEIKGAEKVGATVGKEIQKTAIVSSLLAMFGILIYVAMRYEFSFAVGAVVAIIHDIMMTMGWFCLSGREFSAPMVAAILTIIGFSINDTIVIFDRIREDLKLGVKGTFVEVMNKALNQTLSRTIITSGTVFLATASLYIFGGGVINDFAFTFLVGILTGTYSSIYIASALVLWWHKGERPSIGSTQAAVNVPEVVEG
jgi:SecD/SecF fusion protein